MSRLAFQYPGQASQHVGMASDLYEAFPAAKTLFDKANGILGFDLAQVCFSGPEEKLKQTAITQPAIFVHSLIVTDLLKARGVEPSMTAGHSLGEYSALVAAGAMDFEEALKLVKRRGELMQKAGEISPGTMAAIIGLDADVVSVICDDASKDGVVQVANYNSPGQIVVSGSVPGVRKAMDLAKERGAKRVVELVVSGAFHSPLMDHARDELGHALQDAKIEDARIPVYANVTGQAVVKRDDIRRLLFEQLSSPVLWEASVRSMINDGASRFYEVGPGSVLTGLLKRIDRNVEGKAVGTVDDLRTMQEEEITLEE